jgi:hypothetical protein
MSFPYAGEVLARVSGFGGSPGSSNLSGRISQPTVLPSGQVKIGCWPGCLSLQPVTLQSAALAEADTLASTQRPSKALIIVLMIILLQAIDYA